MLNYHAFLSERDFLVEHANHFFHGFLKTAKMTNIEIVRELDAYQRVFHGKSGYDEVRELLAERDRK